MSSFCPMLSFSALYPYIYPCKYGLESRRSGFTFIPLKGLAHYPSYAHVTVDLVSWAYFAVGMSIVGCHSKRQI